MRLGFREGAVQEHLGDTNLPKLSHERTCVSDQQGPPLSVPHVGGVVKRPFNEQGALELG